MKRSLEFGIRVASGAAMLAGVLATGSACGENDSNAKDVPRHQAVSHTAAVPKAQHAETPQQAAFQAAKGKLVDAAQVTVNKLVSDLVQAETAGQVRHVVLNSEMAQFRVKPRLKHGAAELSMVIDEVDNTAIIEAYESPEPNVGLYKEVKLFMNLPSGTPEAIQLNDSVHWGVATAHEIAALLTKNPAEVFALDASSSPDHDVVRVSYPGETEYGTANMAVTPILYPAHTDELNSTAHHLVQSQRAISHALGY